MIEQAKKQGVDGEKSNIIKVPLASMNEAVNADSENPSQQKLSSLLEHYQNGRLNDAEKLAVSISNEFPKHQFEWKVLGALLKQTGRVIDSLTAMQKSLQLAPQDAEAHCNLGNTLKELGRFKWCLFVKAGKNLFMNLCTQIGLVILKSKNQKN